MSPRNNSLEVFLHGEHIGVLTGSGLRMSFRYDPDVVAEYGASSILLSLSLPVDRKKIDGTAVYNFFDGLLPEGQVRSHLASENRLSTPDALGLLAILGADCAGAVQALPAGTSPDDPADFQLMTVEEVVGVVEALPTWDLPDDFAITASLGGIQSKVLLSRHGDGWAWPGRGAVSTHIFKPEPLDSPVPHLLASEDWALKVAAAAGLPAAQAHLETFGSRQAIVVTRYDRTPDGGRLHQEDFTQALALASTSKYETSAAPPSRLTQLARAAAPHTRDDREFRRGLLRAITFNLVIGNGDAHSKNYSLLLRDGGEVMLAPLYDIAPTLLLYAPSNNAGHVVGGQSRLNYLTLDHVIREGVAWGMDAGDARATAVAVLESAATAAAKVPAPEEIGFLGELIAARAGELLEGGTARRALAGQTPAAT
ncbi:HipA domain-containing protein [Arthrobacter sp. MI7-26]|uniref:type II toxin-antitoxin system HipA family toxin n=1 Tax=Arthrobacter sp. MI7-26 TaxID=2993653 RepID=UPI0022492BDB|nr:HipA domain-containing protein [Arthrobacter sp. MI7-26]MCX2749056.1 HipA domain-containing protein [Arthrobacter sp. MI7-26]